MSTAVKREGSSSPSSSPKVNRHVSLDMPTSPTHQEVEQKKHPLMAKAKDGTAGDVESDNSVACESYLCICICMRKKFDGRIVRQNWQICLNFLVQFVYHFDKSSLL